MLDDRTTSPDPALVPFLTWTFDDNVTGWSALLGERAGSDDVPAFASPARALDVSGLPPNYLDVGELDIFATRTSSARAASRRPGRRRSCTSTPASRTPSRRSRLTPTSPAAPAPTGSAC